MIKAIEIAKKISNDLDKNWTSILEDVNLHTVFLEIYMLPHNIITLNTMVAYVIFSYDTDSNQINLKQDRIDNKIDILEGLGANPKDEVYLPLLYLETADMQEVISKFLNRQRDWRYRTAITCFDFHSKHIKSAMEPTNVTDELEKSKINKSKGELLQAAIKQREIGESLLLEIKKDFVKLDHITQTEFGFNSTDIEKIDIMSWRQYIKRRNTTI